jgi:hypothetical protein
MAVRSIFHVNPTKHHLVKHNLSEYDIELGKIILREKSKEPRGTSSDQYQSTKNNIVEFAATMNFLPNSSSFTSKISAYFKQYFYEKNFVSLQPTILVHMMVPSKSEVFTCIEDGNLEGLLQLLRNGQASLTNCDERGRSLLAVGV